MQLIQQQLNLLASQNQQERIRLRVLEQKQKKRATRNTVLEQYMLDEKDRYLENQQRADQLQKETAHIRLKLESGLTQAKKSLQKERDNDRKLMNQLSSHYSQIIEHQKKRAFAANRQAKEQVEEQKLENKINYQRYWLAKLKGFERERNSKKPVDEMAEKEKVKELQRMKSLKQQQMLLIEQLIKTKEQQQNLKEELKLQD